MMQHIKLQSLPKPRFKYTQCVRTDNNLHISGMIALDAATGKLEPGGCGPEAVKILANLQLVLSDLNLNLQSIVKARIYTTNFEKFSEINAAWDQAFSECKHYPARSALGVSALPLAANVEIEFLLYSPESDHD